MCIGRRIFCAIFNYLLPTNVSSRGEPSANIIIHCSNDLNDEMYHNQLIDYFSHDAYKLCDKQFQACWTYKIRCFIFVHMVLTDTWLQMQPCQIPTNKKVACCINVHLDNLQLLISAKSTHSIINLCGNKWYQSKGVESEQPFHQPNLYSKALQSRWDESPY